MTPRLLFWCVFCVLAAFNHRGVLAHILRRPSTLGSESLAALGAASLRVAAVFLLVCLARAAGERCLRPLRLTFASESEAFVCAAAAGLGILHYLLFALGLLGLWTAPVFLALALMALYPALKALPRPALPRFADRLTALLAVPVALAVLKGVLAANAPVSDWDSLAVHLELPRIYARDGAFTPVTWLLHGMDAMAAGLFFVPALSLGDENLAPTVMLAFQGLMAVALWSAARSLAGPKSALAAAALFLVSPAVVAASGSAGSDFVVGLWGMLSFWAAWRGRDAGRGWLVFSGVLAGLAAAAKLSGFLLAAALLPLVVWDARRRRDGRGALLWLAAAAAALAPWLLRAAAHTGNPVWPHFAALFGGDERALWLDERARRSVVAGLGDALGGAWPLLVPLGVILAATAAAARRDAFTRRVAAYTGLFGALWVAVQPQWRYVIPVMPWLFLLAARGAAARPVLAAVLAIGLLPVFELGANNEAFAALALRPADGRPSREAYLARRVDVWPALRRANQTLPADAKVLLYREVRGYHLERPYLVGDPQNEVLIGYETIRDEAALRRRLLALGITHVLVNTRRLPFAPLPEFLRADALMGRMLARGAVLKDETGGVRLYELSRF